MCHITQDLYTSHNPWVVKKRDLVVATSPKKRVRFCHDYIDGAEQRKRISFPLKAQFVLCLHGDG